MITITIFTLLMLVFLAKVIMFGVKAAFGITQVVLFIVLLPLVLIGLFIAGLVYIAIPLVAIGIIAAWAIDAR